MATLTDNLSNGLKSLFSGLGAKTTNTTNGGVPLLNTSTGEPNGMMEMGNLANTLAQTIFGVGKRLPNSANLNDYRSAGVFSTGQASDTNTLANCPVTGGAIVMIVFNPYGIGNTTSGSFQLIFTFSTIGTGIFYRTQSGGGWLGWKKVDMTAV